MKIERVKNAGRNMVFGTCLKIYQMLIPFVMRTIMLYFLGEKYLGLSSLFTSVLQVLNLAELGVGAAMVYSMYKPIAENDTVTICALMRLYRIYYRIIGLVIACVGLILTPFIPNLINGDLGVDINIYILYLLNLGATVLSYWLFAYKNSLIQAHQRTDIASKVSIITSTIQYAVQIFVLIVLKNYYLYVITLLATQALNNIITAMVVDRMYPDYHPYGRLPKDKIKEINGRVRDLFTSKIGMVIVNSADSVVISAFLGLTMLAVYENYYFVMRSIIGFVDIIFFACTAGIGNSLIVETKYKNFQDLNKFTFIIFWISGLCCCCFLCLYQPFMKIWVGEKLMLNNSAVICLVVYFLIYEINRLLNTYKDAAGMWHQDRFRPLITAISNLLLNLILVQYIGIYGVLLSTVFSMLLVGMPWLLHNLFTFLFDKSLFKQYFKSLLKYTGTVIVSCVVSYLLCQLIDTEGVLKVICNLIICVVISNFLYFCFYCKTTEFAQAIELLDKMTKNKFGLVRFFDKNK